MDYVEDICLVVYSVPPQILYLKPEPDALTTTIV